MNGRREQLALLGADLLGLDQVLWAVAAGIVVSTAVVVSLPSIRTLRRPDHGLAPETRSGG